MLKSLLFLLFYLDSSGQKQLGNFIKWSDTTRLTYADFSGVQDSSKDSSARKDTLAAIDCTVKYKIDISEGKRMIHAYAAMYPERSFMKVKAPYILRHEQGHFDITEIYARKFEKMINDTLIRDIDDFFTYLTSTLAEIMAEVQAEHDKYDAWTRNTPGQDYYYKWIHDQLYPSNKPDSAGKSSPF
jgi:hypothetical protein